MGVPPMTMDNPQIYQHVQRIKKFCSIILWLRGLPAMDPRHSSGPSFGVSFPVAGVAPPGADPGSLLPSSDVSEHAGYMLSH